MCPATKYYVMCDETDHRPEIRELSCIHCTRVFPGKKRAAYLTGYQNYLLTIPVTLCNLPGIMLFTYS